MTCPGTMLFMYSCRRCDGFHQRWCPDCGADPACHDHNCWSTKELALVCLECKGECTCP